MTEQTPTADPWATRNEDGTITLHWPEDVTHALCSRSLIEGMVNQHNRLMPALVEALTRWQADDDHLCEERRPDEHDGPHCERPRINQIRRSIGLTPID